MATKFENVDENVENENNKQINSNDFTGGFGWWQMNITIFYFVAYILTAINNLGYVFQAANTDFHCVHPIIITPTSTIDSITINNDLDPLHLNKSSTIDNFFSTPSSISNYSSSLSCENVKYCSKLIYNNSIEFDETITSKVMHS